MKPYKLASAELRQRDPSVLEICGRPVGGSSFALIAGPCTIESRTQTFGAAEIVRDAGASFFRAGAYKPRSSPYSFQGLGRGC